jgi:hypothetical protein
MADFEAADIETTRASGDAHQKNEHGDSNVEIP